MLRIKFLPRQPSWQASPIIQVQPFPKAREKSWTIKEKHGFFLCSLCLPRFLSGYKAQRVMFLSVRWWYVGPSAADRGEGKHIAATNRKWHACVQRSVCAHKHRLVQTLRNTHRLPNTHIHFVVPSHTHTEAFRPFHECRWRLSAWRGGRRA